MNLLNALLVIVAAIWSATSVLAVDVVRTQGFAEGQKQAAEKGIPHLVLVHGSPSWQPLATTLLDDVWENSRLVNEVNFPVVLTTIAIAENPDKEEQGAFDQRHNGWNPKSYRTLPALQLFSSDGHLLLVRAGKALHDMVGAPEWAAFINQQLAAAATRRQLRAALDSLETQDNKVKQGVGDALPILDQLLALPFNPDADAMERLALHDPEDRLGWLARLEFKSWDAHLREIKASIDDDKANEVIEEMTRRLAAGFATPPQQALLLGGKGMALASMDQLAAAWQNFEQALAVAPDDPLARAVYRYGERVAGRPLRVAFPTDSILRGREVGDNLTRDQATFTLSSAESDNPQHHASLFRGPYSPSGFAFHTAAEKQAHITIDLAGACALQAIRIVNRNKLQERAASLKLWTSTDGEAWQQVWHAEEAAAAWDIPFKTPINARFLKVGLEADTPVPLHLLAVDAYGQRH